MSTPQRPANDPAEPPPAYDQVVGAGQPSSSASTSTSAQPQSRNRNGLTVEARRSMEDMSRPLPKGWLRQFDQSHKHHFYVDTTKEPPRSIWHHPHDDQTYLSSLSSEERERIQAESHHHAPPSPDVRAESTDEEGAGPSDSKHAKTKSNVRAKVAGEPSSSAAGASSSAAASSSNAAGKKPRGFGEKLKDKLTGTTHDERVKERARREREEQEMYRAHMAFRNAMARAYETGQPQLLGRDQDGKDVYVEPPGGPGGQGASQGWPYNRQSQVMRGDNPYATGPYANPNARFIRPPDPYYRPAYGGYGGGLGLPLAAGLTGGLLLGGLMF